MFNNELKTCENKAGIKIRFYAHPRQDYRNKIVTVYHVEFFGMNKWLTWYSGEDKVKAESEYTLLSE
jgi:hypothetical protein